MSAYVKMHNGTPTLFIDDHPTFAGYLWSAPPTPEVYPAASCGLYFAEAGIHLYAFDVGTSSEWCGPGAGRSEAFDFSTVEARFGHILRVDPEARFHLRIHLEMPEWWQRLYPDECEISSEGQRMPQSFASQVWREQARTFLRAYVACLRDTGLAERVIAYQTGAGGTGEWVKQTAMSFPCGDYSQPMRRHFRTWLRHHYNDDVSTLQEAWQTPHVTFDTAEVPSADEHLHPHSLFRDPRCERSSIDYFRCLSDLCADLVIDFCRTVKEATGGEALAGAFFGYLMELAWNSSFFGDGMESTCSAYQRSGHLGLRRVLLSPYVDFLVSPYSYGFRGIGGEGAPMPPTESLRLHGKLYIFEEDSRTHLSHHDLNYGRVSSLEESVAVLRRNIAQVVTRGLGIWWLGHTIDPAQEPAFRSLLHRFQELGTFALRLNRTPCAEVAVLLDDESFLYETVRNDLDLSLIFQQRLLGLPRLGAPYDVYLLQDLIEGHLPPYKLYIFLNAFRLDQTRREALARELRRDGRVAVWLYAPGYIHDDPSTEHMTELTGFRFGIGEQPWPPFMHIVNFEHPITTGLPQDLFWSAIGHLHPLFHLEDPDALILGQMISSQGRCKPGMGIKVFREWTSLYIAVPNVPAPVLRGIARFAGVHLYSEASDVLYAAPQLLGVHTVSGGERTFHLPRAVDVVYDLFGGTLIARDTDRFQVVLPAASTALYYTGDVDTLSVLHTDR